MPKVDVKKLSGEKKESLNLAEDVFGVERNDDLIHQVYLCQASNRRQNTAHTKTRGERRGSSQKPWRQKGTGRARVGTVRNPIWRKGGVAFGPRSEKNYQKKINIKMKKAAIRMVLSGKLADGELVIVENNNFLENKTKEAQKALDNLKLNGSVLWAFDKQEKENFRVSRNLENVENIYSDNLNIYDILNKKFLILTKKAVKELELRYGKAGKSQSQEDKNEEVEKKEAKSGSGK
ncbi:MAG: 50S ribosomal protein L4 [Patescibacteria group bacterium]